MAIFRSFVVSASALLLLATISRIGYAFNSPIPVGPISEDCMEKMCDTLKIVSTCPVFGVNWNPDCAEYFLGYVYQCPGYPGPDEVFDAPSVCLKSYIKLLAVMGMNKKLVNPKAILNGNYSEYCVQNCYQNFVDSAKIYQEECPLANFTTNSITLNAFRGISCGSTNYTDASLNENCYDALQNVKGSTSFSEYATGPTSVFTDFTCSTFDAETYTNEICPELGKYDCCLGNYAIMQSQTFNTPFPPCLMKNCREIAPITDLCGKNINFGTGSVQGYVSFTQSPPDLVNMYNKSSVFNFQKILSRPLELYPKNVSIFDFTYYDNSGAEINENKASVYNAATGGNFSFLITLVDTTLEELTTFFEYVGSSEYETDLSDALYANGASSLQVSNVLVRFYEADPIQTSSAASYFTHSMLLLPICLMFLNMFWMF